MPPEWHRRSRIFVGAACVVDRHRVESGRFWSVPQRAAASRRVVDCAAAGAGASSGASSGAPQRRAICRVAFRIRRVTESRAGPDALTHTRTTHTPPTSRGSSPRLFPDRRPPRSHTRHTRHYERVRIRAAECEHQLIARNLHSNAHLVVVLTRVVVLSERSGASQCGTPRRVAKTATYAAVLRVTGTGMVENANLPTAPPTPRPALDSPPQRVERPVARHAYTDPKCPQLHITCYISPHDREPVSSVIRSDVYITHSTHRPPRTRAPNHPAGHTQTGRSHKLHVPHQPTH